MDISLYERINIVKHNSQQGPRRQGGYGHAKLGHTKKNCRTVIERQEEAGLIITILGQFLYVFPAQLDKSEFTNDKKGIEKEANQQYEKIAR